MYNECDSPTLFVVRWWSRVRVSYNEISTMVIIVTILWYKVISLRFLWELHKSISTMSHIAWSIKHLYCQIFHYIGLFFITNSHLKNCMDKNNIFSLYDVIFHFIFKVFMQIVQQHIYINSYFKALIFTIKQFMVHQNIIYPTSMYIMLSQYFYYFFCITLPVRRFLNTQAVRKVFKLFTNSYIFQHFFSQNFSSIIKSVTSKYNN